MDLAYSTGTEPIPVRAVRQVLITGTDIREEIAFQNEVNVLLAALSEQPDGSLVPIAALFTTPRPRFPQARRQSDTIPDLACVPAGDDAWAA